MQTIFKCKKTQALYETGSSRQFQAVTKVALRKLDMIFAAAALDDLRIPPANRLEALKGDRAGQHSIRINDQWRICFEWDAAQNRAVQIKIVDYH